MGEVEQEETEVGGEEEGHCQRGSGWGISVDFLKNYIFGTNYAMCD